MKTKHLIPFVISLASTATPALAAITITAVGTINDNNRTILEATGNATNWSNFSTIIADAYANNRGGVLDFEAEDPIDATSGSSLEVTYGASGNQTLILTVTGGTIRIGEQQLNEATSGTGVLSLLGGGGSPRTYTPDTPLLWVSVFNTDRNAAGRNPQLIATFQDGTTASTSGANTDNWFFHALQGTMSNPIVSFQINQDSFARYDDLGFVVIPEPSTTLLLGLAGMGLALRRRRR